MQRYYLDNCSSSSTQSLSSCEISWMKPPLSVFLSAFYLLKFHWIGTLTCSWHQIPFLHQSSKQLLQTSSEIKKKKVSYQFSVKITNISYFWGGCCHKMHDKKWLKEEVFILSWRQQTIRAGSHVSRHLRNIEFTCRALWSCLLLLYRISTHGMLPVTIKMIFFNFNLPAGLICVFVAVIKHWPNTWIWNSLFHITFLQHNESLRVSKARTQYRNMGKGTEAETVEE